jgi:hypothetical protein
VEDFFATIRKIVSALHPVVDEHGDDRAKEALQELSGCVPPERTEFPDELPEAVTDTMILDLSEQVKITLFPKLEPGQPVCDILRVDLTQIEGDTKSIAMTPDEAIELAGGLTTAVQMYLLNQEQYRKDILEPRLRIAKERKKNAGG